MTNDDEIRKLLEEIKRSQDAFVADWRAAREEARHREQALREEQARLKAETAARQKEYRVQMIIVFIVGAFVVWQLLRSRDHEVPRPSIVAPSK
jgi:hypothetical protein